MAAIIFLTRLPVRFPGVMPDDLHGRAIGWFPLVGALIGLAGAAVHAGATMVGLPPMLAAPIAIAAMLLLTGALHEDGLADVADGFGGGRDRAAKLEIMRDSRVGTFGAAALVLSLGVRAVALAYLATPVAVVAALVAAGAGSRAALPAVAGWLDPARSDGLAASQGRPKGSRVLMALGFGLAVPLLVLGGDALPVLAAGAVAALAMAALARRQIGGYTGDVLGAVQQMVEITMLLTLVAYR